MEKNIKNMSFDGGCLCLDFVNTVYSRKESPMNDYLRSYEDVIHFGQRTEILSPKKKRHLLDYTANHPEEEKDAFHKIKIAREELYQFFYNITEGESPTPAMMDHFNKLLPSALSHLRMKNSNGKIQLAWEEQNDPLLLPLWKVIKSAHDILLTESPKRIKSCPRCLWLFLDETKNNGRKWCNSIICGSRDKALRYYYRKKEEDANDG